jgi:chromosome partitioning protein
MLVIVAFVSQKGGVGKSTLARALATSASAAGTNVVVADLDFQQETVGKWAERRDEYDSGPAIKVERHATAAEAIGTASLENQLLVLDAPPRASRGTLEIARRVDLVVQPTGPGIDDLDPAILLFHELSRSGIANDKLAMALSRVASKSEADLARRYVEKAGYTVLPGFIQERISFREAHNRGLSIAEPNDLDRGSTALMHGLLGLITERVKARVRAPQTAKRKTGRMA